MPKEKPKRPTSSVSGRVGKLHHVNRFCPLLVRMKIFFVCGQDSLTVLLQETATRCVCGLQCGFDGTAAMDGHVLRTELCYMKGHRVKWASSSILGNRLVHGFMSSGLLESQYQGFAEAAEPGNVGDKYIDFVYDTMGHINTVNQTAEASTASSICEVQNTDSYKDRNGADSM